MSKKQPQVLVRLGFSDVVISKEDSEKINDNIELLSIDNNSIIATTNAYLIGYEFEDGTECNEDGSKL